MKVVVLSVFASVVSSCVVCCYPKQEVAPCAPPTATASTVGELDARALVEAKMRTLETRGVEIQVESTGAPTLPLPDLRAYLAWPQIPDALATPCFVHAKEAWCHGDRVPPLEKIVTTYDLATHPETLDRDGWKKVVTFGAHPVSTAAEAKAFKASTPERVANQVKPFELAATTGGGATATFFTGVIGNDVGPIGIDRCVVTIAATGATSTKCEELFRQF